MIDVSYTAHTASKYLEQLIGNNLAQDLITLINVFSYGTTLFGRQVLALNYPVEQGDVRTLQFLADRFVKADVVAVWHQRGSETVYHLFSGGQTDVGALARVSGGEGNPKYACVVIRPKPPQKKDIVEKLLTPEEKDFTGKPIDELDQALAPCQN